MKKVHSEILYVREEDGALVHSDTCPPECDFNNLNDDHKKYLHDLLDEWLNKSNGTGIFYVKEEGFTNYGNEPDISENQKFKIGDCILLENRKYIVNEISQNKYILDYTGHKISKVIFYVDEHATKVEMGK